MQQRLSPGGGNYLSNRLPLIQRMCALQIPRVFQRSMVGFQLLPPPAHTRHLKGWSSQATAYVWLRLKTMPDLPCAACRGIIRASTLLVYIGRLWSSPCFVLHFRLSNAKRLGQRVCLLSHIPRDLEALAEWGSPSWGERLQRFLVWLAGLQVTQRALIQNLKELRNYITDWVRSIISRSFPVKEITVPRC